MGCFSPCAGCLKLGTPVHMCRAFEEELRYALPNGLKNSSSHYPQHGVLPFRKNISRDLLLAFMVLALSPCPPPSPDKGSSREMSSLSLFNIQLSVSAPAFVILFQSPVSGPVFAILFQPPVSAPA